MKKLKELEDQHKQNEDDLIAARAELKEQELVIVGYAYFVHWLIVKPLELTSRVGAIAGST